MKLRFCIVLLCIFFTFSGKSQYSINSAQEKDSIALGMPFEFSIEATVDSNLKLLWPPAKNFGKEVEVLDSNMRSESVEDSRIKYSRIYTLTSFTPGIQAYSPGSIKIIDERDTEIIKFDSNYVFVSSPAVDTTQSFKDIKDPIRVNYPWWRFWWILIIVILLGLMVILYLRYFKNKSIKTKQVIDKTLEPEDVEAMNALRILEDQNLWQQNQFKEYYSNLTDIMDRYLLRRYGFDAEDRTTDEILHWMQSQTEFNEELIASMTFILNQADMAKFAKSRPLRDDNIKVMEDARNFVNQTKISNNEQSDS